MNTASHAHPCGSALNSWEALRIIADTATCWINKGTTMKFSPILSAKSLALASALIFGAMGAAQAQGYDQGGSMQQPGDSTQSGTSGREAGGESGYGTKGDDQRNRYDGNRDNPRYGTDRTEIDDKDMYEHSGADGTGPKLKGRY